LCHFKLPVAKRLEVDLPMLVLRLLFAFALAILAGGVARAQTEPEQLALLARMREAALTYSDHLQDFVCTQIATRNTDKSGSGRHWKKLDVQEFELSYVGHNEHYKLLKVNGHAENLNAQIKKGYGTLTSSGEFGGMLRQVFDPFANAEFTWDHDGIEEGRNLCSFRYNVLRANSRYRVGDRDDHLTVAHHGVVHADCNTGAVMRIQMASESRPVTRSGHEVVFSSQVDVRYRPASIGATEFLLPDSAETIIRSDATLTRAEIQFRNYHKFQADSKIVFNSESERTGAPDPPGK
jgi:hypothetical protein